MRAQQSKFLKSIDSSAEAGLDDSKLGKERSDSDVRRNCEEATQVICSLCRDPNSKSPLSYLILLEVCPLFLCRFIVLGYLCLFI